MTIASISLNVRSNVNADLQMDFKFDDVYLTSMTLTDIIQPFRHEFDDSPSAHKFEIVMSGKLPEWTKLDANGNIIEDVFAEIFDVKISEIPLGQVFYGQSTYFYHNRLGQFYRQLGCNGVVTFNFYCPAYAWLMENL
jgi:hypothetical protein